jgi:DNA-binding NarL/FixJ family response regulator
MTGFSLPAPSERLKVGGPQRVLIVVDPPALEQRMAEVVRALPGLEVAGSFHTAADAVDWMVWERGHWHFAFVDLDLPDNGARDVIQRLLAQSRPGTVIALGPHLWREIKEKCAQMAVYHLLEKGDLIAFQGFLEAQVR